MKNTFFLVVLLCLVFSRNSFSQNSGEPKRSNNFNAIHLEFNAATLFIPNNEELNLTYGIGLSVPLCFLVNPPPKWCWGIDLEIWRRPRIYDPWIDMIPEIIFPPVPPGAGPGPDPAPWDDEFQLSKLKLGEAWIFTPSIGASIQLSDKINLSFFGGGGFQYTESATTELNQNIYKTAATVTPLLTFGANSKISIANRLYVKIEFQNLITFESNMDVIANNNSVATFQGGTLSAPMLSLGLGYGLTN